MINGNGLPKGCLWASGIYKPQVLPSFTDNDPLKNAACFYTADPEVCRTTMTFRINTDEPHDYQVSLYFPVGDNHGKRHAIKMFDANTLNKVAPVKVISGFSGDIYFSFSYNKSTKFRIDRVRGDNAILNGIILTLLQRR